MATWAGSAALAQELDVETFESLATARVETELSVAGGAVGQVLRGQGVSSRAGRGEDQHWVLDNRQAEVPLALVSVVPGNVVAVVYDGAFGSQALAGVVTPLFDTLQCIVGRRSWLDRWQDNIVQRRPPEGNLNLIFRNRNARPIAEIVFSRLCPMIVSSLAPR